LPREAKSALLFCTCCFEDFGVLAGVGVNDLF